eukprot:NODE_129_length_18551_cov_0.317039.p1 type:complete len:582 gc:universal NODE_129_length_18551_cov_0.317039:5438-7183(+)
MFIGLALSLILQLESSRNNSQVQFDVLKYLHEHGVKVNVLNRITDLLNIMKIEVDMDITSLLPSVNATTVDDLSFFPSEQSFETIEVGFSNAVTHDSTLVSHVRRKHHLDGDKILIGIVDSGIDSQHHEIVNRVVKCYDYTLDGNCVDYTGHGTHVAGVAAGANLGVASKAVLISYKVFRSGGASLFQVLLALNQCLIDRVDIVNLSIVSRANSGLLEEAISRLYDNNIIVVAANGNTPVMYNTAYPASNSVAISVSSSNTVSLLDLYYIDDIPYLGPLDIQFDKIYQHSRSIQSIPHNCALMLKNVLLKTAIRLAMQVNAKYLIICVVKYPATQHAYVSVKVIYVLENNCLSLSNKDTFYVVPNTLKIQVPVPVTASSFNVRGPSLSNDLKPEISAPGNNIISISPNNRYAMYSGSSMASPYIAGVAALYMQLAKRYNLNSHLFKMVLMNTATRINGAGPSIQGSGFVNAKYLIETRHAVTPYKLTSREQLFTIMNYGSQDIIYKIRIESDVESKPKNYIYEKTKYKIHPDMLHIKKNTEDQFSVLINGNQGQFFGGFIIIEPSKAGDEYPELSIPFMIQ